MANIDNATTSEWIQLLAYEIQQNYLQELKNTNKAEIEVFLLRWAIDNKIKITNK